MSEVTRVLSAIEQGDPHAAEQLLPLVYDELRKLAAQKMAQTKRPARRSRLPAWSTKPISDWWASTQTSTGTAGDTSSPLPPRPCGASFSTAPANDWP